MGLMSVLLDNNKLLDRMEESQIDIKELSVKDIISTIEIAGLREGERAGVLVAEKWKKAQSIQSNDKVIICNGYERQSRDNIVEMLFNKNSSQIIKGLIIGAKSIGASTACIYVKSKQRQAVNSIKDAIDKVQSDDFGVRIELKEVPEDCMYGDEISTINILQGNPNKGIENNIQIIDSPETFIRVYSAFLGDSYEKLSQDKFVVLNGVKRGGQVLNIPKEVTLRNLIYEIGGVLNEDIKALLVGGTTGVFIKPEYLDLPVGHSMFNGGDQSKVLYIDVIYNSSCMVDFLKTIAKENKKGSCNKCVFCREGMNQIETILTDITEGNGKSDDIYLLKQISNGIKVGSGCCYGRNIINPILSSLEHFSNDFDEHINRKKCSSLVCKKYFTYHILGKLCKGCEECLDICPAESIDGGANLIHVIDQDECTKCGKCLDICPHNAIVKAGLIKPKTPLKPVRVGTWKR